MAISKVFGSAQLRKPGAYSISQTSPDSGSANATTGVLMLMGEADAGPGGASEGIQTYSAAAFNQLKAKYRSGPLVDAAKAALAPSLTPGINGAGTFLIWKTNASAQASYAALNTYGTIQAKEYGVGGNRITYKNTLSAETPATITGTAAVTAFSSLNTQTLLLRVNGTTLYTVTFVTPTNMSDVTGQINAVTSAAITASNSAGLLTLTMNAGTNLQRAGWSRSLEIQGGSALGNLFLTTQLATPSSEPEASLELIQPRDSQTQAGVVGGDVALEVSRDSTGSCTAANITISSTAVTLAQTGATPSSVAFSLANYPLIGNLVDGINETAGWTATCSAATRNMPTSTLDRVSTVGAFSTNAYQAGRIKQDAYAVAQFFAASTLAAITSQATKGLPDQEGRVNLAGGTRGATSSSDFDAGFSAALAIELNAMLPCISQDASADITMGLTDPASTYDIETVHAMLSAHLTLRGSIKNRKEAQGAVGYRVSTKAAAFNQAATIGSALVQMCMEDVLVVDSSNTLTWKQPHIQAALLMGFRMGSSIGEPATHKVLNVQGVGHYVNPTTGVVGGDYLPLVDYDAAIDAGVTSSEPANGGYRWMIDNTTYGADASFVFNRGSVMEAAQYIAKTVRSDAEAAFVGKKTSVITASSIKNRIRSKMVELFNAQVTSPSDDAPQGFREDTFIVEMVGNTATVQIEAKPVQGVDFVLITFTLGETRQSA